MGDVRRRVLDLFRNLQAVPQKPEQPTNAARWKIIKEAKDLTSEVEVPGAQAGLLLQTMSYVACIAGAILGPIGTLKVIPPEAPAHVITIAIVGELTIMALVALCVTISRYRRR
ncbi:hypothetical protein [Nonomuraea fuscirosea]|uniref:hypothetical protein n=1 Tax=Nonomuraea fuscirosea TaxID=1291556 RepID=UPI00340B1265